MIPPRESTQQHPGVPSQRLRQGNQIKFPGCDPSKGINLDSWVPSHQGNQPQFLGVIPASPTKGINPNSQGVIPASPKSTQHSWVSFPGISLIPGNLPARESVQIPRMSSQNEQSCPTPSKQVGRGGVEETPCPKSLGWGDPSPSRSPQIPPGHPRAPRVSPRWPQAPCPSCHTNPVPSSQDLPHNPQFWGAPEHPQHQPSRAPPSSGVPPQAHPGRAAAPEQELGIICVEGDIYKKLRTKQELFSLPRDYGEGKEEKEKRGAFRDAALHLISARGASSEEGDAAIKAEPLWSLNGADLRAGKVDVNSYLP